MKLHTFRNKVSFTKPSGFCYNGLQCPHCKTIRLGSRYSVDGGTTWLNDEPQCIERKDRKETIKTKNYTVSFDGSERSSCTINALAFACDIAFSEANQILQYYGKKPNRGFDFDNFISELKKYAHGQVYNKRLYQILRWPKENTMKRFCKAHPRGTYIISVREHVYVIKDGIGYDHSKHSAMIIEKAFEFVDNIVKD